MQGASTSPKRSAINTRRKKYVQFAYKYSQEIPSLIPIFPLDLSNLMRYVLYLASDEGNIKAGWNSCSNFVSEIVTMGKLRGWEDPRAGTRNQFLWARFRQNFRTQIQVVRKAPRKLRLTPAHLQAIIETLNLEDHNDLRWAATFATLWHTNARVGHAAPKSKKHMEHVWKFEDLVFVPTINNPDKVVIHFRSSKTRSIAENRSFWTAVGKVELQKGQPNTCPVRLLQMWVQRAYTGNPKHPLFASEHDEGTPILRSRFTSRLRQCLVAGAQYLAPPHNTLDPKAYSGVSFRKGSLSAMSGVVEFNRLRERADHKCPESTSHYVSDSVQTRAQSTVDVHTRFAKASSQSNTPQQGHELWIIPVWHRATPNSTHAQVMVTIGAQSEEEQAEDKLKYVAIRCATATGEAETFAQVHEELVRKLARAADEHTWVEGGQEAAEQLTARLKASDVTPISRSKESTTVAVHFTNKKAASLFTAIVATQQQAGTNRNLMDVPAWATAAFIDTCGMAANTARRDIRAWYGALKTAETWVR